MIKKGLISAALAFALVAGGGAVLAPQPAHANGAAAGAAAAAAAAAANAAREAEELRTIATSPSAEVAMEQGLDYSLSHYFEQCQADENITESSQRDITDRKAQAFKSCLEDYRRADQLISPSQEIAISEYGMSERSYDYLQQCRVEYSNWDEAASYTGAELRDVENCLDSKESLQELKTFGIVLGGIALFGGAGLYAMRP